MHNAECIEAFSTEKEVKRKKTEQSFCYFNVQTFRIDLSFFSVGRTSLLLKKKTIPWKIKLGKMRFFLVKIIDGANRSEKMEWIPFFLLYKKMIHLFLFVKYSFFASICVCVFAMMRAESGALHKNLHVISPLALAVCTERETE